MPILALDTLASRVTRVVLERPARFRYQPGDYIFIRYPQVANHEWHPFTLTSCPEEADRRR